MAGGDLETAAAAAPLLPPPASSLADEPAAAPPPADRLGVGYLIFFTLGAGFLLPWNAYITAVDYFAFLYPGAPVDRVFSVSYMLACLLPLLLIVLCFPKSSAPARINTGLALFTLALLVVPAMDAAYVKGRPGMYGAFDVTVAATVMCGVADALVQGGVIGFAGELPERYMQAVVAGTAASGVASLFFSFFRPPPPQLLSVPCLFFLCWSDGIAPILNCSPNSILAELAIGSD